MKLLKILALTSIIAAPILYFNINSYLKLKNVQIFEYIEVPTEQASPLISSREAFNKGTRKYNPRNIDKAEATLYLNQNNQLVWKITIGTGYLGVPYWEVDANTGKVLTGGNLGDF